jgi:hypothetical protein
MTSKPAKVVAVMQPYFASYAGYYRLMAASDLFVIFDCVQFPRRGWVHRNQLPDARGEPDWLTLPLKSAPFEAPIQDLAFAEDAEARMADRLRAFPSLQSLPDLAQQFLRPAPFRGPLVDYLEAQIRVACAWLGRTPEIIRSSALGIPGHLRAQERVLEVLRLVGATDYLNAPGGRGLYDADAFEARRMKLHFLESYEGEYWSLLHRLATDPDACRSEILAQTPDLGAEVIKPVWTAA